MLTRRLRFASGLVIDEDMWPDDFGFDEGDAAELDALLARHPPVQVLQVGSGATTALLALYARRTGARILTIEPVPARRARTLALLGALDLLGIVAFDDCGAPGEMSDPRAPEPPQPLAPDLVVIDGHAFDPTGLSGLLQVAAEFVRAGATLWVSRGVDSNVARLVDSMAQKAGLTVARSLRRYATLAVAQPAPGGPQLNASRLVITVLTGGRPSLLERTLSTARGNAHGLLETAQVIAFHNGRDRETRGVLDAFSEIIDIKLGGDADMVGIGEASSLLATHAADSGRDFWLHLEDDWQCHTWEHLWLERAQEILDSTPEAAQVRLRHIGDRIQRDNFVTGEIVEWEAEGDVRVSNNANWTFNPSLVRVSDINKVYPVAGEANACRKATAAGLIGIVQLLPGVFTHLGLHESLRRRTHCSA